MKRTKSLLLQYPSVGQIALGDALVSDRPSTSCGDLPTLASFFRDSWHVLEGAKKLDWNWHLDAICEHVGAVLLDWDAHSRDIDYVQRCRKLLVTVPPGSAKSRIVSVCAPAWFWLYRPDWSALCVSSNPRVALRDAGLCRELIQSDWYQRTYSPSWRLREDSNAKSNFANTAGGTRLSFGFGSRVTGVRADAIIVDDPHDAEEVTSERKRESVIDRWDSAIANRLNDYRTSATLGIMQRLDERDWGGHVLATKEYDHLSIRQEYELSSDGVRTFLGWEDPRKKAGELMFAARFTREVVESERQRLGARGYAAQHQQNPSPAQGNLFKIEDWSIVLPGQCDRKVISVDASFKGNASSDYVVIAVVEQYQLGEKREVWNSATGEWDEKSQSRYVVVDLWRGKAGITETQKQLIKMCKKHPGVAATIVEDAANGPAIIEQTKQIIPNLIAFSPGRDSKVSRATAIEPIHSAGNLGLLIDCKNEFVLRSRHLSCLLLREFWQLEEPSHRSSGECAPVQEWAKTMIDEFASFPVGANDDQVDAVTQAILWCERNAIAIAAARRASAPRKRFSMAKLSHQ